MKQDFISVKTPFRSTILQNTINGKVSDEISLLESADIPLLIVFGEDEMLINHNYLDNAHLELWNSRVHKITEAGHMANLDKPEVFNQLLKSYCTKMFTISHD